MSRGGSTPEINVVQTSIELEQLPNGNFCLDSKQADEGMVGNTELAGVGFQDLRDGLVESDLDIGLRKANVGICVVEWCQIQFHERPTDDLSAYRRGQARDVR